MQKKVINWLGYGLIFFYIAIFLLLNFLGFFANNYYSVAAVIWLFIMLYIIPKTLYRTWFRILPSISVHAKLVTKNINGKNYYDEVGFSNVVFTCFVVFELANGSRKIFNVSSNDFNTNLIGEAGILTYKEQGKHLYFVSFERQ